MFLKTPKSDRSVHAKIEVLSERLSEISTLPPEKATEIIELINTVTTTPKSSAGKKGAGVHDLHSYDALKANVHSESRGPEAEDGLPGAARRPQPGLHVQGWRGGRRAPRSLGARLRRPPRRPLAPGRLQNAWPKERARLGLGRYFYSGRISNWGFI